MATYNAEPDVPAVITATEPTEMKAVECKACGKAHEPIREFRSEGGWYVCSWGCLGAELWNALYGTPCPPERLAYIRQHEADFWRGFFAVAKS